MSTKNLVPQYHVQLDVNTLDDPQLHQLAADVKTASTTSQLVLAYPALQTSAAAIGTKDAALTKYNTAVGQDRMQLASDLASEYGARSDLRRELRIFATLASGYARTPADLQGAALTPRAAKPRGATLDPTPPDNIINKPPKKGHGRTTVVVQETGPTRHEYVAEQSLDGTTWTQLGNGHGKTRVVTGASGTKIWVRFAMVKSGRQSDWSTPFLVTIP